MQLRHSELDSGSDEMPDQVHHDAMPQLFFLLINNNFLQ